MWAATRLLVSEHPTVILFWYTVASSAFAATSNYGACQKDLSLEPLAAAFPLPALCGRAKWDTVNCGTDIVLSATLRVEPPPLGVGTRSMPTIGTKVLSFGVRRAVRSQYSRLVVDRLVAALAAQCHTARAQGLPLSPPPVAALDLHVPAISLKIPQSPRQDTLAHYYWVHFMRWVKL